MKNFKLYFSVILFIVFFSCNSNYSDKNKEPTKDMKDLNSDSNNSDIQNKEQSNFHKKPENWGKEETLEILRNVQIKFLMASMVTEEKWENNDFIKSEKIEYCFDTMYFEGILIQGDRSDSASIQFWVDEELNWIQELGRITKQGNKTEFTSDLGQRGTLYFLLGDKVFKKVEVIPIGCT